MTDIATNYYNKRLLHYMVEEGLPKKQAEERADYDMIEWSKPLDIPPTPEECWYE